MTDREYEKMMVDAANGKTQNAKAEIGILDKRIEEQKLLLSPEFDYGVDDESA